MARLNVGDLGRWLTAAALGEHPVVQSFDCEDSGTRCRLDVLASVPVRVEVNGPAGRFPIGVTDPAAGPLTVEFVGQGMVHVEMFADLDAVVAVRRYDDRNLVEVEGDSFTSYDPANFVDGDMERIERLMRHNQLAMMSQLQEKYDAQIARLQSMQSKEAHDGSQGSEGASSGAESGSSGRQTPPQAGDASSDGVTDD